MAEQAKTSKKTVWLLNHTEAFRNLSYHLKGDLLNKSLKNAPGFNIHEAEMLQLCGWSGSDFDDALREQSPLDLPEYQAVREAQRTVNAKALKAWMAAETRGSVRAAIAEKLEKR